MNRFFMLMLGTVLLGTGNSLAATQEEQLNAEATRIDSAAKTKGEGNVTNKISSSFESFAGSRDNANSLVTGLRTGSTITLSAEGQEAVSFDPPTRPMGYGNVTISLSLARQQLAAQGITDPTPSQLETALMGGDLQVGDRTVALDGVLQMRASGMGWGQIAHTNGVKLGPVVSSVKTQRTDISRTPSSASTAAAPTGSTRVVKTYPGKGIVTAAGTSPAAVQSGGKPANPGHAGAAGNAAPSHATTAAGHGSSGAPKGKAVGKN